jgi:hypothetical protein
LCAKLNYYIMPIENIMTYRYNMPQIGATGMSVIIEKLCSPKL